MRVEVVLEDVGARENGAKAQTTWEYAYAHLRVNLWNGHLWVGGSCLGKRIELKLIDKAWAYKKKLLLQVFPIAC